MLFDGGSRALAPQWKLGFPRILAVLAIMIFPAFTSTAQNASSPARSGSAFPDWMDQVDFGRPKPAAGGTTFTEPREPADPQPSTGKGADTGRVGAHFKFIKPRLPDFSGLRKKSVRTVYGRTASGSTEELVETISVADLPLERSRAAALASECLLLASGPEKIQREEALSELLKVIAGHEEIASILKLPEESNSRPRLATIPPDLSPAQKSRLRELRHALMTPPRFDIKPPTPPEGGESVSTGVFRIPEGHYRPEPPPSFYKEMKKAQEEGEDTP